MSRRKSIFFILLPFFSFLFSCSIQKRHYTKGFYLEKRSSSTNAIASKYNSSVSISPKRTLHVSDPQEPLALNATIQSSPLKKPAAPILIQRKKVSWLISNDAYKNFSVKKTPARPAFLAAILPNHVAKAGLRLAIIGLVFLAGAYYLLLHFPDLSIVIVALLIISAIYALVSIISSVNARKDKINNTKGWLGAAAFAIVLSILLLCAIALFLIFLF